MSTTSLAVVYGTAAPPGRLSTALAAFAQAAERAGAAASTIDLHAAPLDWADGRPVEKLSAASRAALQTVAACEGLVLFSPVYRAAAPGALKNFLDLVPFESLVGKPVGLVAMGATLHHFLAVESDLGPILSWFGAVIVPPGLYLSGRSFEAGQLTPDALDEVQGFAAAMADMAQRLRGRRVVPTPLAGRRG